MNFEIEKRTIETNVLGFTCVSDWAFNYFEKQKFGHLVAISSIAGIRGNRQATSYNATKAYQINYLEGLRQKAKNLKNVIISQLRNILKDLDGLELIYSKGRFFMELGDEFYCDYFNFSIQLDCLRH